MHSQPAYLHVRKMFRALAGLREGNASNGNSNSSGILGWNQLSVTISTLFWTFGATVGRDEHLDR